jgi:transcriptional regulator with XRE-family HTH domain
MASRDGVQHSPYEATLQAIGHRLIELRKKKGYDSQLQFAIDHGLSHIQYWRMERGVANLTFKSLDRVLAIHGLTIEQLFDSLAKRKSRKILAR